MSSNNQHKYTKYHFSPFGNQVQMMVCFLENLDLDLQNFKLDPPP